MLGWEIESTKNGGLSVPVCVDTMSFMWTRYL